MDKNLVATDVHWLWGFWLRYLFPLTRYPGVEEHEDERKPTLTEQRVCLRSGTLGLLVSSLVNKGGTRLVPWVVTSDYCPTRGPSWGSLGLSLPSSIRVEPPRPKTVRSKETFVSTRTLNDGLSKGPRTEMGSKLVRSGEGSQSLNLS